MRRAHGVGWFLYSVLGLMAELSYLYFQRGQALNNYSKVILAASFVSFLGGGVYFGCKYIWRERAK